MRSAIQTDQDLLAGVLVFDCWVSNTDRKPEDLIYVDGKPVILDHSHTLLATRNNIRTPECRRIGCDANPCQADCKSLSCQLVDNLREGWHIRKWAERVQNIQEWQLEFILDEARMIGPPSIGRAEIQELKHYLLEKRKNLWRFFAEEMMQCGFYSSAPQWEPPHLTGDPCSPGRKV